jgi:hypothetical protein
VPKYAIIETGFLKNSFFSPNSSERCSFMFANRLIWLACFLFCLIAFAFGSWQFAVAGLVAFVYVAWRFKSRQ